MTKKEITTKKAPAKRAPKIAKEPKPAKNAKKSEAKLVGSDE